jgi:hypothetical protein
MVTTQVVQPVGAQRFDIRCNVGDAIVANLATHIVFFFDRRLDIGALTRAFAAALEAVPIFAGRMAPSAGSVRIRCRGRGVPFTTVSSRRTLREAIRSTVDDAGLWLVDPVNGAMARWGIGPLCKVRVTQLADDATAIGFSWHHMIGDMQTAMHFMDAWEAAAAGNPLVTPLIVGDRAAYLDEHLPVDGAQTPGVRCMGLRETARSAVYLATESRRQRTLSFYFCDDEIARMRDEYGIRMRLSANDVVCAHVSEALMTADPDVQRRSLAIAVNARNRCGLDPMLVGNIITTLNVEIRRGESAGLIAERIRHHVDHFADEHCDMRINQEVLDAVGPWRGARCVSTSFNPARWNPVVTNLSEFGLYRFNLENTFPTYCTLLMAVPVAGLGVLMDGADGRGLVFQMSLPPSEFEAMSSIEVREHMHRFRCAGDDIPRLHRELHG